MQLHVDTPARHGQCWWAIFRYCRLATAHLTQCDERLAYLKWSHLDIDFGAVIGEGEHFALATERRELDAVTNLERCAARHGGRFAPRDLTYLLRGAFQFLLRLLDDRRDLG